MLKTRKDVFREILEYFWEKILEKLCGLLRRILIRPVYLQIYTIFWQDNVD